MIIVKRLILPVLLLLFAVSPLFSQDLYMPSNISKAYSKGTRSSDGKPGQKYWQNTADYSIKVKFDPATRKISGKVKIKYVNNSPDTLNQIWFKLYPNIYQKGAPRASSIAPEDINDGVKISYLSAGGHEYNADSLKIDATNMVVDISPLHPGKTIDVTVQYNYELNKGSHNRTGQVDEGSYFIAYFFPRIAVYDDIDGWNKIPYTGPQEFYNDFCNFEAEISVPRKYVVWATGDLSNTSGVFTKKYVQRIDAALKSNEITTIIDSTDLIRGDITRAGDAVLTWKYSAQNVTDFVFALSDHYMWQSSGITVDPAAGRRTRVDAVFNPRHRDFFEVAGFARKTAEAMSYSFPKWPYPYPHETVFDGLDQMEYPMMVNDNPLTDRNESISLTDHEIFHTMFPFYMGINETKYGWMDEGWATIGEWEISRMIDTAYTDKYGVAPYAAAAGSETDLPIIVPSTHQTGYSNFLNSYPKPAFGYLYVKDLLGDELFFKALHFYISSWHGKHPGPYDFFNCMNTGSGRDLNWFWKAWFFDSGKPDLSVGKVTQRAGGYDLTVNSPGSKPVPVDVKVTFFDNSVASFHRSIDVWEKGNKSFILPVDSAKKIKRIELGSTYVPDSNPADNICNF